MENRKEIVITANKGLFSLHLSDVWAYRDLVMLLVRRDFVANYKQTILGPLWFFLQPLLTTLMFTFLFAGMGRLGTGNIPAVLFYMCGITFWNYFAACIKINSTTFITNQSVFGKVYFPRLVIPISVTLSNLIKLAIQFLLFISIYLYFILFKEASGSPTIYLALLPLNIILLGVLGLGSGILISSLTTKYRDLNNLVDFGLQLLMYATVLFSADAYPARFKWFTVVNPLFPIIETTKLGLLGSGTFDLTAYIISILFTITTLVLGVLVFNKTEQNFMDVV